MLLRNFKKLSTFERLHYYLIVQTSLEYTDRCPIFLRITPLPISLNASGPILRIASGLLFTCVPSKVYWFLIIARYLIFS